MAIKGWKKFLLIFVVAASCFLLGGAAAYFLFLKDGGVELNSLFQNPSGPPHIEGPTGPPPQSYGGISSPPIGE
ncbi:MAG: hypothetical protein PHS16_02085 [Candidatus Colwellbacteria bacterium]|jgi:hypothetical protein|nr:hypothetical protein [Candidatus Colwellbacteria bacterium]MCK9497356.1 hypothetical protein [Candidatus Colwellbacteria bacterium]MDD3752704.1 hypothetical protein [Candidatus Colwellbacteria bacterium]MDD4818754.1 hypothetical protein [Candidatus Colwellbacteria bacterium]